MSWWGKLFGGALGFSMGGPLGLLIGSVIGHKLVDKPMQGDGDHEDQEDHGKYRDLVPEQFVQDGLTIGLVLGRFLFLLAAPLLGQRQRTLRHV